MSQRQPENTFNVFAPHSTNFATDKLITTPLTNNSRNIETWDDKMNADRGLYNRPMFTDTELDPAQYTYPSIEGTTYHQGRSQYEAQETWTQLTMTFRSPSFPSSVAVMPMESYLANDQKKLTQIPISCLRIERHEIIHDVRGDER